MALVVSGLASGQHHRPLPTETPAALVARVPVHVVASDELEPDVLRALARPGVTLWLETSSNTLRDSTLDSVLRFERVWVQLRAPITASAWKGLAKIPRAGIWVAVTPALDLTLRGVRPVALEVRGAFDGALVGRADELWWLPTEAPDLLEWSRFTSTVVGRRLVRWPVALTVPSSCTTRDAAAAPVVHVSTLLAMSSGVFPCGSGTRVELNAETDPWLLQSLVVRDPSVELVLRVGNDVRQVGRARLLLEALGR